MEIGARTRLMANLYMEGPTTIGADINVFFPFSSIGVASQDMKYKGERAFTRIGNRNRIREFVTIHRGTDGGGLLTAVGDDNLLMAYTHTWPTMCESAPALYWQMEWTLGGHVAIGDNATIGAFTGVHQFCRIGREAFIGGYSVVTQDVMPFASVTSDREIRVFGANRVGLERRGFSARLDREPADGHSSAHSRGPQHVSGHRAHPG